MNIKRFKETGYIGNNSGQGKNENGDGCVSYGLFLAPKLKLCYTIEQI